MVIILGLLSLVLLLIDVCLVVMGVFVMGSGEG